jgi:hypothetical protein
MSVVPLRARLFVLFAALFLVTSSAEASPETCARSYEQGQSLRKDGKLLEARREIVACSQDACPSVLRKDCIAWLSQIGDEIPSVAIRVHGPDGCDRPDAKITIDGTEAARAADGRAVELDPGSHTLRVVIDNTTTDRTIVVSPGERRRIVTVDLAPPGLVCGAPPPSAPPVVAEPPPPPPPPPPMPVPTETKKVPPLVYVFGSLGIVSAGVGGAFGILAWSDKGTLDDCKGRCAQSDVDAMQRSFVVADIATVVAVLSLGAAAVLYLTR